MSSCIEKIENIKVEFDEKRILRLIGYRKRPQRLRESLKRYILEEKKKLDILLQPVALYKILNYDETNKHSIFKNAEKVALCLCTIGPKLEKEVQELMKKNEMLRALVLDALGSEAVEEAAIQSDKILAEKAREMNLWASKRFSPGYGKWDIREQSFIFEILPAKEIGVRLTESYMMVPRKSISFRINFYKDKNFTTRPMRT